MKRYSLIAAAALSVLVFASCEKKETAGEKLDNATEATSNGLQKLTQKASDAAEKTNTSIQDSIKNLNK